MTRLRTAALMALGCLIGPPAHAAEAIQAKYQSDFVRVSFPDTMATWPNTVPPGSVTIDGVGALDCMWEGDTILDCTAPEGSHLADATSYRVRLGTGFVTQSGTGIAPIALDFETPRPSLHMRIREWKDGRPVFLLSPTQRSTAAQVAQVLRLQQDGKAIAVPTPILLVRDNAPANAAPSYTLELPADLRGDSVITLTAGPGLHGDEGPLPGTETQILRARIDEPQRLRKVSCASPVDTAEGVPARGVVRLDCVPNETLWLQFSGPMDPTAMSAWAESIAGDFKVERTTSFAGGVDTSSRTPVMQSPGVAVELRPLRSNAKLRLAIPATFAASPTTVEIATTQPRPRLTAPRMHSLLVPPATDAPLATVIGQNDLPLLAIGAGANSGREEMRLGGDADTAQPFATPATRAWLEQGGWARWRIATKNAEPWGLGRPLEFAAPAFDLLVVEGRDDVLVWANEWTVDAPVAGARVELLLLTGDGAKVDVITTATTAADGTARLVRPVDWKRPELIDDVRTRQWLVRAVTDEAQPRRAVLPVDPGMFGAAPPLSVWGVSDRPLYRAGDTVKYRLWVREVRDDQLRAVTTPRAMALRLVEKDHQNKNLREWEATTDSRGNLAGEIVLPAHLPDATYCVSAAVRDEGACFFVGTYRAQDLWSELVLDRTLVRAGDPIAVQVTSGYYSGGPGSGIPVKLQTLLEPWPIEQAYPDFAAFTFADVAPEGVSDELVWQPAEASGASTDAAGRLRATWPLVLASGRSDTKPSPKLPLFGRLRVTAEVKLAERESAQSDAAKVAFAGAEKFVGVRVDGNSWQPPLKLEAVVLTAEGREVPRAAVDVDVVFDQSIDGERRETAVGSCRLVARVVAPCAFTAAKSGMYVFRARSPGAETSELRRFVWIEGQAAAVDGKQASLTVLTAPTQQGEVARLQLAQPFARSRALVVARNAGEKVWRVERFDDNGGLLALQTPAHWRGKVTVDVQGRSVEPAATSAQRRVPSAAFATSATFAIPVNARPAPVVVTLRATPARPGARAIIEVRNDSAHERDVVVAIVDDAVRALAGSWLEYQNPLGVHWLGEFRYFAPADVASFATWSRGDSEFNLDLPWMDAAAGQTGYRTKRGDDYVRGFAEDKGNGRGRSQAVTVMPSPPEEPAVVFDDPSPVDVQLDAVVVTGSLVRRVDTETASPVVAIDRAQITRERTGRDDMLTAGRQPGARPRDATATLALARLRSDFRDTALWLPDLRLAPGERRTIEVTLPDNLTRWRALAWSSDADDGFALAEAAVESGLPLEARVQAPVRVYPGDTLRVSANVRRAEASSRAIAAELTAQGAGLDASATRALALAAGAQDSFGLELAPKETGRIAVVASAGTTAPGHQDAVGSSIEVASPRIAARLVQAGWLSAEGVRTPLPALPDGASDATVHLQVDRGGAGLVERWTHDLHDYPHRCWEQILSRAVAAALARARGDASWPDADAVVHEALDNAAVFQRQEGDFSYFADAPAAYHYDDHRQVGLTAYSVHALALLRSLGYPVDAGVEERARDYLAEVTRELGSDIEDAFEDAADMRKEGESPDPEDVAEVREAADELALAAGAIAGRADEALDAEDLASAWAAWEWQSLPARIATARALHRAKHPAGSQAITRLLEAAPRRGLARRIGEDPFAERWMGSPLRDQCELMDVLREVGDAETARSELLMGLTDLYAGGVPAVDTQAGAQCLIALRTDADAPTVAISVEASVATQTHTLTVAPDATSAEWSTPVTGAGELRLARSPGGGPASYVAELAFEEDARQAQASSVGLRVLRRYAVFRDDAWREDFTTLREGEWVRITLQVDAPQPRHFVAVSDAVPGGLQPTDLRLRGIAGPRLERLAATGSQAFGTRRLDPRTPRFYADYLPRGRHEIHYFARAGNAGDYLAAPAVAELMYGQASRARTAAQRVVIERGADAGE